MRVALQWLRVLAAGWVFGSACSSSDEGGEPPPGVARGAPSDLAGAAGSEASGDAAGVGGSSWLAAGSAGLDEPGGAGAGGADPCAGNYSCPAVSYWSHAIVKVDLPVSVAQAADAVFSACRNDECYSAPGSASLPNPAYFDFLDPDARDGWVYTEQGEIISLRFDGSGAKPFAVLYWRFTQFGKLISNDHYSLTIQAVGASAPTTLFDGQVNYTTTVADPSLARDGFCSHCSEVSVGTVDARAAN